MTWFNPLVAVGLAALPLSLVPDESAVVRDEAPAARDDAAALVRKLGDKDYKTRKEAFRALERMGERARAELEQAQESDDAEVRWSASLLLDRLDEDAAADEPFGGLRDRGESRRFRSFEMPDAAMQEMREAMRRIEAWQERLAKELPGGFDGSPFGLRLFDDAFRRFRFDGIAPGIELGPGSSFSRVTENDGRRESLSIRVDQDGRVTVEREQDGETTKVEADSLDELKEQHPELLDGIDFDVRVQPSRRGRFAMPRQDDGAPRARARSGLERPQLERDDPKPGDEPSQDVAPAESSPKPRLGVQVQPVSGAVAEYLELDEGVGLEVVRVVAGSAAEKLGIKVRDVITEVNGRTIRGVEDVAAALGTGDPAQAEVTVLRRGQEMALETRDVK